MRENSNNLIKLKTNIILIIPLILLMAMAPILAFSYSEGSPYDQQEDGVPIKEITCRDDRVLMIDLREKPGCAFEEHVDELESYGWTRVV